MRPLQAVSGALRQHKNAGKRRTALERAGNMPKRHPAACRRLFWALFGAHRRLKLPGAAPLLAKGVLLVCCWWSGAALPSWPAILAPGQLCRAFVVAPPSTWRVVGGAGRAPGAVLWRAPVGLHTICWSGVSRNAFLPR
eukprot:8309142-Alexandrium_andersonii.AAC.1